MRILLDQLTGVYTAPTFYERRKRLRKADSPAFRFILFYCFSPSVVVREYDFSYHPASTDKVKENTVGDFMKIVTRLRNNDFDSPAHHREVMADYVESFPPEYRWLVYEIVRRDLQIRITAQSIMDELPGTLPATGLRNPRMVKADKVKFPVWVLPQPVGPRVNIFVDNGFATVINRRGDPVRCLTHITDVFGRMPSGKYEVEIAHPDGNENMYLRQVPDIPGAEKVVAIVRDWMPIAEAMMPKMLPPDRFTKLGELRRKFGSPVWSAMEPALCRNITELVAVHKHFTETEGHAHIQIILNAPFEDHRKPTLLMI